jgi:hypothetical protein
MFHSMSAGGHTAITHHECILSNRPPYLLRLIVSVYKLTIKKFKNTKNMLRYNFTSTVVAEMKTSNNKCLWERADWSFHTLGGGVEWYSYHMVLPKLNTEFLYDVAIPLLLVHTQKNWKQLSKQILTHKYS